MKEPLSKDQFTDQLYSGAASIGVSLGRDQVGLLYKYYSELGRWNQRINLVSRRQEDWLRIHFIDSLAAVGLGLLKGDEKVLDMGAGAGFPGLVLKVTRPDIFLGMAEASGKKCAWLRHIYRTLELNGAQVLQGRFSETLADGWGNAFDLVVSRAAAKPRDLIVGAAPFLAEGGRVLSYTTEALVVPGVGKVHPYRVHGSEIPSVIWEVKETEIN